MLNLIYLSLILGFVGDSSVVDDSVWGTGLPGPAEPRQPPTCPTAVAVPVPHVERKELNGAISLAPRPLAPPPRPADPPAGCGWLLHYCTKYCEWYYWHVEQRICLWRWVRTATGLTLRDAATLPIV